MAIVRYDVALSDIIIIHMSMFMLAEEQMIYMYIHCITLTSIYW